MKTHIDLTRENIKQIDSDDLIAITIAEGGAMGDMDAIEIVGKDLKVYYTHFGKFENEELEKIIPFLKTISGGLGEVSGLPEDWSHLYTGYGNNLFVRPELKDKIIDYVRENYKDFELPEIVELYSHWYEALENIVGSDTR